MTVATLTWRQSALYTVASTVVADMLAGLKAAVDAEVAANPSTYKWSVADYSAANGTLVLKPSNGDTRRFMVFGGQLPNANAVDSAAASTTALYCGLANTAGVDAPQQSYTAGVPFTTGQWLAGGTVTGTFTSIDRVEYWENSVGIFVVWRKAAMTAANANSCTGFGGQLAVSLDNNTAYDIAGGSAGLWVTAVDTTAGAGPGHPLSLGTESTNSNPRTNYYESGVPIISRCKKFSIPRVAGDQDSLRTSGNSRYFIPYLMINSDNPRVTIKMRQMALGVQEVHGQSMSDSGGVVAYKIAVRSDAVTPGIWLTNFQV